MGSFRADGGVGDRVLRRRSSEFEGSTDLPASGTPAVLPLHATSRYEGLILQSTCYNRRPIMKNSGLMDRMRSMK